MPLQLSPLLLNHLSPCKAQNKNSILSSYLWTNASLIKLLTSFAFGSSALSASSNVIFFISNYTFENGLLREARGVVQDGLKRE